MLGKKCALLCVGILASSVFFLSGCGSSSPSITVNITGGTAVVDGNDTVTLTATVSNDSNSQGVTWSVSGGGTLSNQTTTSVVYTAPAIPGSALTVTVTATSVADTAKSGTFTITIPAQLTITTTSATACMTGAVGTAFSCQLTATEGEGTLTWTVDSSTPLPTGWHLSTSGLLTGPAPMNGFTGGTYKFDLTDSGTPTPMTTSVTLTVTINAAAPIVFSTTTVPPATGTYNTPYSGTVLATGGVGALTYTLQSGALPTGLNAITSGGLISGIPNTPGTYNFTIEAADAYGDSNTQAYQVVIAKATPLLTFAAIPAKTYGDAAFQVTASDAVSTPSTGAITYSLTAGQTSAGTVTSGGLVTITGAGTIYLTATQAASGDYAQGTATTTVTVNAETPTLTFNAIPTHYVGDAAFQATATDSTGPVSPGAITYSLTAGQASAGTVTSGGLVTITGPGTIYLTATQAASGNYAQATATTTVTVDAGLSITTPTTLPTGVVGTAYSQMLSASGGTGSYTWSLVSGSTALSGLGLTFTPGTPGVGSTASVAGATPIAGGPVSFVAQVGDTDGHSLQETFSVTVNATLAITTTTLSPSYVYTGTTYPTQTINVVGGASPYTWSISAGSSALAADGLSLSSGTGTSNTISGTVLAGDPVGPINFTVKVVDHNGVPTTQSYTLQVYGALSLTTPSSSVPGPAVEGNAYAGSNITATGGSGSYSWTVTGLSGTSLTYNSTGNPLIISGTAPSTSETLHPEVTVEDTATSQTYGPIQYSIVVGPATPLTLPAANPSSLPGGTVNQYYSGSINASGGSGSGYVWSINGTQVPTDGTTPLTLADGLSAYSSGGNTLSINGTTGGTAQTVTLQNVTVTDSASDTPSPTSVTYTIAITNPAAGYNVSGTVSYTGSLTGWIYLQLVPNSGCNSCGNLGTAISAPGTYTIHGVPPGTYTLQAWMDNTSTDPTSHEVMGGYGGRNAFNPTGTGGSNVVVSTGAVNGANVTLLAPSPTPNLGSNTPTWDPSHGFGVFNGGAFVSFDPIVNGPDVETPNSYIVQWSLTSSFSSVAGSQCFPATADQNPWIVTGISGTGPYYFRAAGVIGSCVAGTVGNFSAPSPSAYTIANPSSSSGVLMQGTVSFSQTATGPLYVGFYNQNTGNIYVDAIGSKASPPTSGVSYSVYVPTGSGYFNFAIVDQNNDGLLVPGNISNVNEQLNQSITISTAANLGNLALPSGNGLATATVQVNKDTDISGNTGTGYNLGLRVVGLYKQPASVELVSGPSYLNPPLFDIATGEFNGNYDEWDANPGTNGSTPSTSDVFTFNVTYTDGTSNSTLNSTPNPLTASPTAILSAFPTLTYPVWNSTGVSTTPTFTWTYPSNASNYTYQFQLQDSNGNTIWQIPGNNSNSNGFSSSISPSITWGVDPTGGGNTPNAPSLSGNTQYQWSIQATDANGNEATTQMAFQTAQTPLSLPSSGTANALQGSPFSESLNAQGGSGSGYVFSVAVGAGSYQTVSSSATLLTDNISVSSSGNTLTFSGTPTAVENITLNVKVTDSASDNAGPTTYYINVVSAPSGVNNGNLKGTYACLVTGYFDSDGARWTALANIYANGSGTLSSGVFNENSRDLSTVSTGGISGTLSGTYAIGSDNNGVMSTTSVLTSGGTGTNSNTWAIALNKSSVSGTVATEFRMVESDDLGSSPSGQHATGDCYLTTPSAFANSTISGNSFAFGLQGENGGGAPKAFVGQFTASTGSSGGTLTSGYMDGMHLGQTGDQGGAMSSTYSSYTAPDSNGRYTLSIAPSGATDTSSNQTYIVYIIDANRMFILETAGDTGLLAGDVRTQQQSSNTAATLLTGSIVAYNQGWEWSGSSVSGYDSSLLQISASNTGTYTGTFYVNASFDDNDGSYQVGGEAGQSVTVTLDSSNPGRATFSGGSDSDYLYFFSPGNAFYLDLNGSQGFLATGWVNSQSGTFTNAGVAGTYLLGDLPQLNATEDSSVGEAAVASNGSITANLSQAGINEFSFDQAQTGITYSWASTTYGTYTLSGTGGSGNSCMVISATTSVCIDNTSSTADMSLLQQ